MKKYKTIVFNNRPTILEAYSVVGDKEKNGTFGKFFDEYLDVHHEKNLSFEKEERDMTILSINQLIKKSKKDINDIDCILGGDLLNQNITVNFAARNFDIPFLGVYSACSSFTESILFSSLMIDAGFINNAICTSVSHFATAERQYRYPLELGSTRPPQAQWTVTGAGSLLLGKYKEDLPCITSATIGKVVDFGVKDANNMGAAMAPACANTIIEHCKSLDISADYYDLILTGDLGVYGSRLLKELTYEKGFDISNNHVDCGEMIYNLNEKEFQGGSGAGCCSVVFNSYIYKRLKEYKNKKILFLATGALLSSTSSQQGDSIPAISHAVAICS